VRLDLGEGSAYFTEDSFSMLGVGLDHFSDEKDSLKRGEGRFAFEPEEILHERAEYIRNSLRVSLSNLVNRLNQQVPVFISNSSLRSMLFHLAGT
jgi:hypothetical protein